MELGREESTREDAEEIELVDVVTAAINRVRIRAPGLTFDVDLRPTAMLGRPGELERMVLNVLDNAAKWSPPGGTVTTTLRADGPDGCRLIVTDEGPGIDDGDRPHIFDPVLPCGHRPVDARLRAGVGDRRADRTQHGGTVTVAPHAPQGTTITVRLPRSAAV